LYLKKTLMKSTIAYRIKKKYFIFGVKCKLDMSANKTFFLVT